MSEIDGKSAGLRWESAARRGSPLLAQSGLTAALAALLVALIAAGQGGLPLPLAGLRLLLSLWFLLFAPGYAVQAAIFAPGARAGALPSGHVDRAERLALSLVLSLAVAAGIALILDRLPCGIRLWPVVAAEGLVIGVATVVAWHRVWRRAREQAPATFSPDPRGWWRRLGRRDRLLYGVLLLALAMSLTAAGSILRSRPANGHFTEFYVLGQEGQAENYPFETTAGQPVTVTLGIANGEGVPAAYRAEVQSRARLLASVEIGSLQPGETRKTRLQFAPDVAGEDIPMSFLLYRDGATTPYRSLRLWLKVRPAP